MTTTTLKKVGNSRAFIIPAGILKKHNVGANGNIYFEELDDRIEIYFKERKDSSLFFKELNEISLLPGSDMSMDDIKNDRRNKRDRTW